MISGTGKTYVRSSSSAAQIAEVGKLPPQSIELETAVLGAILLESSSLVSVYDFLIPECFYKEIHGVIFRAICTLYEKSEPIDMLTVIAQLKSTKELDLVGGRTFIAEIVNSVATSAHIERHGRIILQKYVQRETIRSAHSMIMDAYDDKSDIFELLDKAQTELNTLMQGVMKRSEYLGSKAFPAYLSHLEKVAQSNSTITGVPTNLTQVNQLTGGFQKSDLIIIAGRPGMGKTSAAKNIINGMVEQWKEPILFFSMEMSVSQVVERFLSEEVKVSSDKFRSKEFLNYTDFTKLQLAPSKFFGKNGRDLLIIDDSGSMSINELRARAKLMYSKYGIKAIVLDYLQMVTATGAGDNKVYEIELVAKGLKQLAKDLDIPVIALAQLSRKVEERTDKRPILSDLRSSGAIEQYADLVFFLHRPEYYGIEQLEDGTPTEGLAEWILSKHRNGGCDDLKVKFISEFTQFVDYSTLPPYGGGEAPYDPKGGITNSPDFPVKPKDPYAPPVGMKPIHQSKEPAPF